MAPKIYTSPLPDVPLHHHSIFTHLFSTTDGTPYVGGFPSSAPAFIDAPTGTTVSRGQTKHLALSLGYAFRNHPKLLSKRGDTVLIFSHNSLSWPVTIFGAIAAGLKCTLANSAYNARELAFQYTDSGARLLFSSEEGLPVVFEMFKTLGVSPSEAEERVIVLTTGLGWANGPPHLLSSAASGLLTLSDLLKDGSLTEEEKFDGEKAGDTVYLCYSSGTTGKPKGVETTHQNLTSVLEQFKPVFPPLSHDTDVMLGMLPFYHIYGAVKLLNFAFLCGVPVVIMPRFDPVQLCANIERYKATVALVVPPVLVVLNRHPAVDQHDVSTLEILLSGAAPLGAALTKQVKERLESRRKGKGPVYIVQGYGLTETSPTTHLLQARDAERKVGSIGILLPNLEARLLVDGDGRGDIEADEGQAGELWIRGPSVMKGYLNNPSATKDSITYDGWFKTGDIAIRDHEGYYHIVDRRKELIKYKGFQVPPAELESVLLTHPDVADTAVIGVESTREATELPRAYIVHARPESLESESDKSSFAHGLMEWIQTQVARHKFLRGGVVVVDVIPKSASGKILRRELRDQAKRELAGKDPIDYHLRSPPMLNVI